MDNKKPTDKNGNILEAADIVTVYGYNKQWKISRLVYRNGFYDAYLTDGNETRIFSNNHLLLVKKWYN